MKLRSFIATVASLALVASVSGCAALKADEPILSADAQKFAACVEGEIVSVFTDALAENAAALTQIALDCGGKAIDLPAVQSIARSQAAAVKAKRASASVDAGSGG